MSYFMNRPEEDEAANTMSVLVGEYFSWEQKALTCSLVAYTHDTACHKSHLHCELIALLILIFSVIFTVKLQIAILGSWKKIRSEGMIH